MIEKEITIVIVNWNGAVLLPKCLGSIARFPPTVPFEVVVVDNASSDDSVEWLESDARKNLIADEDFLLISSDVNLGFGRANNLAFSHIQSEFIFLLNPDAEVREGTFDELLSRLKSNECIPATAPKIVDQHGNVQFSVGSNVPTPLMILIDGLKLANLFPIEILRRWLYSRYWDYSIEEQVPVVSGASFLVRRRVIDEIGGFDEDFHMYGEDLELSIRILRKFGGILFVPSAVVEHAVGQSSRKRWTEHEQVELQELEHLRYQRKTCGKARLIGNAIAKTLVLLALLFWNVGNDILRRHFWIRIRFQVLQILSPASLDRATAGYLR